MVLKSNIPLYNNIGVNYMNDITLYILILLFLCLMTYVLYIAIFRKIRIRMAIRKNKLLLKRLREKNADGNYHTYQSLLQNSLLNLRNKIKRIPSSKLENMVIKEIRQLLKNPVIRISNSVFLFVMSFLMLGSLFFSLIFGLLVVEEVQKEKTYKIEFLDQIKTVGTNYKKAANTFFQNHVNDDNSGNTFFAEINSKIRSLFMKESYEEEKQYNEKPEYLSQQYWDVAIACINQINEAVYNNSDIVNDACVELNEMDQNDDELLLSVEIANLMTNGIIVQTTNLDSAKEIYEQSHENLKEIFGNNLN